MRPTALLLCLALAGCAFPDARQATAPGAEFPSPYFDICLENDAVNRCTKWKYGSGERRPYDVPPGYVLVPADQAVKPKP